MPENSKASATHENCPHNAAFDHHNHERSADYGSKSDDDGVPEACITNLSAASSTATVPPDDEEDPCFEDIGVFEHVDVTFITEHKKQFTGAAVLGLLECHDEPLGFTASAQEKSMRKDAVLAVKETHDGTLDADLTRNAVEPGIHHHCALTSDAR